MSVLVWVLFTFIFASMALQQEVQRRRGLDVPHIDLGFNDLNDAYEATRDAVIRADRRSHLTGAISFALAAIVSLASAGLSALDN